MNPTRPFRFLLIYAAAVFLGTALLSPWIYQLAQFVAPVHPLLQKLAAKSFHRYFETFLLVLALAGLWPLSRNLGVSSWREIGVVKPAGQWSKWLAGFLLGFGSLALVAGTTLSFGGRAWTISPFSEIAPQMSRAVLTAIVVAILEEILFRGGIYGGLRRVLDWRTALPLSSVIYALAHFFRIGQPDEPVVWASGLKLLVGMLARLASVPHVFPALLNLTLVGLLLGLAYQRTGNLYFPIGLHAGWIFWLKSYGALTDKIPGASAWFWGGSKMFDGWLAFIVLSVAFFLFNHYTFAKRKPPE